MKITPLLQLEDVLALILDAVCVVDKADTFIFVSSAFEHMFGYLPAEVIGRSVFDFVYVEDRQKTAKTVASLLSGTTQSSFENRWLHKSGKIVDVLWSARWSEQHQVRIAVAHDISERKQMEQHLEYLAKHDSLTSLPNRATVKERLQKCLNGARVNDANFYVLFIDVDKFKAVNDNYGHTLGDRVLEQIAQRLLHCVRDSDTVGRIGGDEFIVLLNNIANTDTVMNVAEKMCRAVAQPFIFLGVSLDLSLSIGIAAYPEHGGDSETLLQLADDAMFKAKKAGGNRVNLHVNP
ncbi:MAG: sensor domain-containing diguanylate cyclase [Paraglaciecola sp.]|nr:sensor domain-containing diguanylate cyclase [Paraglaciecola sp.]